MKSANGDVSTSRFRQEAQKYWYHLQRSELHSGASGVRKHGECHSNAGGAHVLHQHASGRQAEAGRDVSLERCDEGGPLGCAPTYTGQSVLGQNSADHGE